ncbi:MAG: molecular chaperone HtpG [Desulfovermiculus sp.]|nr:molecular chaperone HtpG [Desulfovermiculus sp.]
MSTAQSYEFQAETQKLLNIIIHSIYTNKEIFLRELISNASDALDKVRFAQNKGTQVADPDQPLDIRITTDKEAGRLVVSDTGNGMSEEELVSNLGTIAKSGTEEFLRQVTENQESPENIIGRFGVGFYSVFMVASQVQVTTKSADPEAPTMVWTSDGMGSYSVAPAEEAMPRGTRIEITLQEDEKEYADPDRVKHIIKKHSNFISFPINVNDEKVNTIPALWKESKFNITQDQYTEFYKFLTYDSQPPLETIHVSVDAPVQFNSILFIPQKSTLVFENMPTDYGLDLYVNRVLIQHKNQDLIPQYLSFVSGVVDTEDLPLNLSRQAIQESALITKIRTTITKQVLSQLEKLAGKDQDRYVTFWKEHGKVFKLGYSDVANQEAFAKLLRFNASWHEDDTGLTSLEEYVQRMKEGQKEIYFISGPNRENIASNPHLELFRSKGLDVLYLFEPVDEFVLQSVGTFQDSTLKAAEHVDPAELEQFASTQEEKAEKMSTDEEKSFDQLLKAMQDILGDRVTEVRTSKRLSSSPACLVNPESGISSQMQKIMHIMNKDSSIPKQILEINPNHPLSRNLLKVYSRNPEDPFVRQSTEHLFEASLLQAGYLADPHTLVNRTFNILEQASSWYTKTQDMGEEVR